MIYPKNFEQKIGFDEIRNLLHARCLSNLGHERVDALCFVTKPDGVRMLHSQTNELLSILKESAEQIHQDFFDLRPALHRIRMEGAYLDEQEIWDLLRSLRTLHQWVEVVRKEEDDTQLYPALAHMADGVFTFRSIEQRIEQILDKYGRIKDEASTELAGIRGELRRSEGSVSRILSKILSTAQANGLVDKDVTPTLRDGRLVIPVAPAMKRKFKGIVHDESATGKTVFIEPEEVVEANNRIRELEAEEKREIIRILREFTALLTPNIREFQRAMNFLADVEFTRAKALLADSLQAVTPHIQDSPFIDWTLAKHPLLEINLRRKGKHVVPMDILLNRRQRILIISGPNAGGKSVCLKTIGLLQYMLQCGLPVTMGENSRCGLFQHILIDIGDEQSIENDLSTYSGHLQNMKEMMRSSNPASLLLIDEFGGGTEPTIGGAIAEAVLKRFVSRGTFGVITTHYQNLKHFAEDTPGVVNGAMLYDRQKMEALFQLEIGNPGSSFAVEIARKTGIPEEVIADATALVGQEYVNADKYLLDITRDKKYWENKRQNIHSREKQMEKTIERYEREVTELKEKRVEIIREARKQAEQILKEANATIENTIREIREAQAAKERTRLARQQMAVFAEELLDDKKASHDETIERKMRQIEERKKRKEENKRKKAEEMATSILPGTPSAQEEVPLQAGDYVRLKGQTTVGMINQVNGKQASVTFGMMKTVVEVKRLVRAQKTKEESSQGVISFVSRDTQDQIRQKHLHFKQDIDVRGMRGEEALQAVTYFIDDAILVGARRVRILHGTGTGILRQLIRDYLNAHTGVESARDEHVQFGGAGITVVELR
ncbi:MAG: endonuclease MutS2 [Bacteroidaceae bacterium]